VASGSHGVAYHAASVNDRRLFLTLVVVLVAASGCTGDEGSGPTASPTVSPPPTVDTGPVTFVPGEYRYEFGGVTATLSLDGSSATMEVKNASGAELGPPGVYVIGGDDARHAGRVDAAAPIPDGGSATFEVTFPDGVDERSVGLVILLFGDSNYGAFAPVIAES
jgi:hypothetical protein